MPALTQSKTFNFSAQQLYRLVMDIEKYPEFLPWCKQAKIIERLSPHNLHADLLVNFKNFFEKYRSDVTHKINSDGSYFINVIAIQGPFKKLINQWKFHDLADGKCQVEFFIDFEFNSFFLNKMLGGVFEKAAEKMMAAFEERAKTLC